MIKKPVIEVISLTKNFGSITAVDDVTFTVNEGDIYGILGPNGAGKTTTISLILGLTKATRGDVEVLGSPVTPSRNSVLKHVGSLVGDIPAYIPYLTGKQNLLYFAHALGTKETRVDEILALMGLGEAADRKPGSYSTGMKQRLGMAMAIIRQPRLLILDEPTNGMDPTGIKEIRLLIKALASQGMTILLCSHLLHEVEQICNKVAIFNKGKIVAEGALAELHKAGNTICVNTPRHDKTVRFLEQLPAITVRTSKDGTIELTGIDSQALIELLVRNSLTPSEIYLKDHSLEEFFVELTSKEE